jgi:hypothetical protein
MAFLRILSRLIDKVLFSNFIRPWLFVFLFNIRSFFWSKVSQNHSVKVKQNVEGDGFLVYSSLPVRHASNKDLVNHVYQRGVPNRGLDLAKAYGISAIAFSPGDVIVDCGANIGDLKIYFVYRNQLVALLIYVVLKFLLQYPPYHH